MMRSFVALPLLLAACSHDAAPPPSPAPATPTTAARPAPPSTPAAGAAGHDITKPCSMISAEEVSSIVGFPVTSVDAQYECKFPDAKGGYLTVKLLQAELKIATDICDYAKDKRTVVSGVGDKASYFGSTVCVKLGDVAIIVDGSNVAEHSPQLGHSGAENVFVLIAKTVASRIP